MWSSSRNEYVYSYGTCTISLQSIQYCADIIRYHNAVARVSNGTQQKTARKPLPSRENGSWVSHRQKRVDGCGIIYNWSKWTRCLFLSSQALCHLIVSFLKPAIISGAPPLSGTVLIFMAVGTVYVLTPISSDVLMTNLGGIPHWEESRFPAKILRFGHYTIRQIWRIPLSALVDLVTLTFHLL